MIEKLGEETTASAVGFAAVADGGDVDGVLVPLIEEHAVITTAKTVAGERRFEFLHVASAVSQLAIYAVENLHRGFTGDSAEIGTGLGRPDHSDPLGRWRFGHLSRPNSCRMSSWGMSSPRASEARARSSAAAVSGVISSSSTGADASERDSGPVITCSRWTTAAS